jgi:hypothetical protein
VFSSVNLECFWLHQPATSPGVKGYDSNIRLQFLRLREAVFKGPWRARLAGLSARRHVEALLELSHFQYSGESFVE